MKKAILLIVAVIVTGCSTSEQAVNLHNANPKVVRAWSIEDLPPPNLSDEAVGKLINASATHRYRLYFKRNPGDWTFTDEKKTDAQLNRTEITFLFHHVPIGVGDQGLANLRRLVSILPRAAVVYADHCLTCQTNRWSKKIRKIGDESRASKGAEVQCDGAF